MLLITEVNDNVNLVTEEVNGERQYHIDGIFMQAEQKNRNGRVYPRETLMNEVARYNKEYVSKNRAMGELNHPQGPTVNLDRVSHIIKELRPDGDNVYGKAKIMETPMGKIAKDNGILKEKHIAEYEKEIESASKADLEEKKLEIWTDFISKL